MAKNSMYLYGKNSVLERLKVEPGSVKKIFLQHNFDDPRVINAAKSSKITVERVSENRLLGIKRADRLQGVVAEVEAFRYADFDELINDPANKTLSFICLDNINDPHNLGSIIRTAACFGGFGVVIPGHNSCQVNDTVMHVASGGENFVPISTVNNMSTALIKAKNAGWWIVGTVVEGGRGLQDVSLPFPLCVIMGSEGKGIRHGVAKQLDVKVTLPMKGAALSFNVAMTGAIFCYEVSRQKKQA